MQYIPSIIILVAVCQQLQVVPAFNTAPAVTPRSFSRRISSSKVMQSSSNILLHQSSSNNNNNNNEIEIASPSGINILPPFQQKALFTATFLTLITSTALLRPLFHTIIPTLPIIGQSSFLGHYLWHPELLGLIFVLAGVSHFFVEDYLTIVPPKGTWGGLWQLPGGAKFHVEWTGGAEILGGVGLFVGLASLSWLNIPIGGIDSALLASTSAAALLGLSIAIYPANFYMYTHGAELPKGVEMEDSGHYGRFVAQIVLCGILAGLI